jgi:hypothetical protein
MYSMTDQPSARIPHGQRSAGTHVPLSPRTTAYLLALAVGMPASMPAAAPQAAARAAQPADAWVIEDVTVIPADTDEALAHRTVVIRDDTIERILPQGETARPANARVIDGRGR